MKKIGLAVCVTLMVAILAGCWYNTTASTTQDDTRRQGGSSQDGDSRKIIVDAGHGGSDPGTIGPETGIEEKTINLQISKKLQKELEAKGFEVIMTRTNEDAVGPSKEEDMVKREEIIKESNADLFVSIHQNFFDKPDAHGPQVFYLIGAKQGGDFAQSLQKALNDKVGGKRSPLSGNYRLCKPGHQPSVIVECGFFSNPEEEKILQDDAYQDKLVSAIVEGILDYIN